MENLESFDIIDLYNIRCLIKNRINKCFKLIKGINVYNPRSVTSNLHFDYEIKNINFRFILVINPGTYTLIL